MEAIKGISAAVLLMILAWLFQGAVPESQLFLFWTLVSVLAFAIVVGAFLSEKRW